LALVCQFLIYSVSELAATGSWVFLNYIQNRLRLHHFLLHVQQQELSRHQQICTGQNPDDLVILQPRKLRNPVLTSIVIGDSPFWLSKEIVSACRAHHNFHDSRRLGAGLTTTTEKVSGTRTLVTFGGFLEPERISRQSVSLELVQNR
jgi:hypothetical protein